MAAVPFLDALARRPDFFISKLLCSTFGLTSAQPPRYRRRNGDIYDPEIVACEIFSRQPVLSERQFGDDASPKHLVHIVLIAHGLRT